MEELAKIPFCINVYHGYICEIPNSTANEFHHFERLISVI